MLCVTALVVLIGVVFLLLCHLCETVYILPSGKELIHAIFLLSTVDDDDVSLWETGTIWASPAFKPNRQTFPNVGLNRLDKAWILAWTSICLEDVIPQGRISPLYFIFLSLLQDFCFFARSHRQASEPHIMSLTRLSKDTHICVALISVCFCVCGRVCFVFVRVCVYACVSLWPCAWHFSVLTRPFSVPPTLPAHSLNLRRPQTKTLVLEPNVSSVSCLYKDPLCVCGCVWVWECAYVVMCVCVCTIRASLH